MTAISIHFRQWMLNKPNLHIDTAVENDSLLNTSQDPIEPRQSRNFFYGGGGGHRAEGSVTAALFADGTSWGDAAVVQSLINKRNFFAAEIRQLDNDIPALQDFQDRSQVITAVDNLRRQRLSTAQAGEEKEAINKTYRTLLLNLQENTKSTPQEILQDVMSHLHHQALLIDLANKK